MAKCSDKSEACAASPEGPMGYFADMMDHCYDYALAGKAAGRPVVAAMCEFTPWELILAAGAVPVCMCGGSAGTIPAAEEILPANLCPLIKSTFGYHVTRSNPFLEMADLVVAETTCDGKKKMYELMGQTRPMHVLELPQKQDDAESFRHWLGEVGRLKDQLERRFKVDITPGRLREAVGVMNRERSLRRGLAGLMKADCPPLTGRQLLDLRSGIPGMPEAAERMDQALQALSRQGPDKRLNGRLRVLLTGVPTVRGAERVVELIEDRGGLIVCTENCTGLKPILDDVETDDPDLVHAIARKYFNLPCSVMTRNDRRLESLKRLAGEYRPDCVIDLVWQACLTYDVESASVRRLVTGPLGLPYLRIETDYSPSDSARLAVRIEALFETVRGARG